MGDKCWVAVDVGGKRKSFDMAVPRKHSAQHEGRFRLGDCAGESNTLSMAFRG